MASAYDVRMRTLDVKTGTDRMNKVARGGEGEKRQGRWLVIY